MWIKRASAAVRNPYLILQREGAFDEDVRRHCTIENPLK
jgi:hypothetical protein